MEVSMPLNQQENLCDCGSGKPKSSCCGACGAHSLLQRARDAKQAQRWDEARAVYRGLLNNPADSLEALQALSELALRAGDFADALQHLDKLCSTGQDTPADHTHRGLALQRLGQRIAAQAAYRQAIDRDPNVAETHHLLGTLFREAGSLDLAQHEFETALAIKPALTASANELACLLLRANKAEEAVRLLRQAVVGEPRNADAYNNLGNALKNIGKNAEAETAYRNALTIAPVFAEAHNNLGLLLSEAKNSIGAKFHYEQALRFRPAYMEAHYNLANLYDELEKLDEAIAHYSSAIRNNPGFVPAYNNLGLVFLRQNKIKGAIACFEKALNIRPEYAEAANNLAKAYRADQNPDAAEAALRKAIALDTHFQEAYVNLGNVLWDQGRIVESSEYYRHALRMAHAILLAEPGNEPLRKIYSVVFSNYLYTLQFAPRPDWQLHREEGRNFRALFEDPLLKKRVPYSNTSERSRPLRVAYLSPDFRTHAVARFIVPLIESHSRDQFRIYCYCVSNVVDAVTERVKAAADVWRDCYTMSDETLAQSIRDDQIDIMIDLAGHTAGNRLLALALKPAPVQITYLGYPGSTWLSAMDYRITDALADPPGTEDRYCEKLLHMPHSLWCFDAAAWRVAPTPLPALKNGYITLGSFNIHRKIDEDSVVLWGALLLAVPSARLLMVTIPDGRIKTALLSRFERMGVPAARIEIRGHLEHPAFLEALREVDIALDPVNINGATTTCEALQAGVPTLNLVGERFLRRAGLSILTAAGIPEFAFTSHDELIDWVKALADDLPRLAGYREKLIGAFAASPLADVPGFTKNLELLIRNVWVDYCNASQL